RLRSNGCHLWPHSSRVRCRTREPRSRRNVVSSPSDLKGDAAFVATETLESDVECLGHTDQQIRVGSQRSGNDMPIALDRSARRADEQRWQQVGGVYIAIAHAAAIEKQRVIEQRSIAIRSGAELLDEPCEK